MITYSIGKGDGRFLWRIATSSHLFNSFDLPVVAINFKKCMVVMANERACSFYGYTPKEFAGMPMEVFCLSARNGALAERCRETAVVEPEKEFETTGCIHVTKHGLHLLVECVGYARGDGVIYMSVRLLTAGNTAHLTTDGKLKAGHIKSLTIY